MRTSISKNWPITVVGGSALFAAAIAATIFRSHHSLASIFAVVFGYAGGYLGYKLCVAVKRKNP